MKDKNIIIRKERQCIKLQELIYELSDQSGINRNEAISLTSMLLSNIKEHLVKGHNINLGELGVMTHHKANENRAYEIRYTPSLILLNDLKESKIKKTTPENHH